jgi:hypothetical protein
LQLLKDGTTDDWVVNEYELLRRKWLSGGFLLPFSCLSGGGLYAVAGAGAERLEN